jgi:transaldolase
MNDQLSGLKQHSLVVADTGDFAGLQKYQPRDATTNPSLLLKAATMPEYAALVEDTLARTRKDDRGAVDAALDRLAVAFGLEILKIVPGRVSTEVDARLSFDKAATIAKAKHLIALYEGAGVARERILVKIASTWEGIQAAAALRADGIKCNLTLLFSFAQAVACAEAGVQLISPFVGRILDWHKKSTGKTEYAPAEDPGVVSVTRIYEHYKKNGYQTEVMGASFRNLGEIVELAGCDLLTIAPNFLAELQTQEGDLVRKLDPAKAAALDLPKTPIDEVTFRKAHEADRMANEKLDEGIKGFSKAIVALEVLLGERYKAMRAKASAGQAARDFFAIYDLDGDGFITREEWGGASAVFAALDVDSDGRITPEEMAAGLGGAFVLAKGAGA